MDDLQDDKPSLKACSLVCKAWTNPSRLHLFASATLKWPLQPAAFPFVRHLLILIDLSWRLFFRAPTWDRIIPLLVGFHRVTSLEVNLCGLSLDVINTQTWLTLSKNFSSVVSLSLEYFSSTDASSLAQVFCAFHHLRKLSLHGSMSSTPTELVSTTTFRLPSDLDTFTLETMDVNTMLEWLVSLPVRPTLRAVRLRYLHDKDVAVFHRFIRAVGDDLESLSLCTHMQGN
jgi:hypothetical protein